MTPAAQTALANLRNPAEFNWAIVPLFAFALYFYFSEMEKKNWHMIVAALGTWLLEFFGEILNALVLHFSNYSALWLTPGKSSFIIFAGYNIEISLMFAVAYLGLIKMLPKDKSRRLFFTFVGSFICVVTEVTLNHWDVLVWDYHYWSWPHIWTIILFAYAPSIYFLYWLFDLESLKLKIKIAGGLLVLDILGVGIFVYWLKWI